jgi:poly(A) polymerase
MSLAPITPQRPLLWPDVVHKIQDSLVEYPAPVYIVGGAVRDACLRRPIHDLDLATAVDAIPLARKIANRMRGDFYVLDKARDVGRVLLDVTAADSPAQRLILDVARLRGADLLADLRDRDFTFNAIAVDLKGDLSQVIDPLNGVRDLEARIIRRCSEYSIQNDPIRTLRAVRQSVQFHARIEPQTLQDIRATSRALENASQERLRDEFINMLTLPRPHAALRVADALGLLAAVVPETSHLHGYELPSPHVADGWQHTMFVVEKLNAIVAIISPARTDNTAATFDLGMVVMALDRYRRQLQDHLAQSWPGDRPHRALLFLAALLHNNDADDVRSRAAALRLSNHEKQRLAAIAAHHAQPLSLPQPPTDLDMHRFWHSLGDAGIDVCLLALADYLGTVGNELDQDEWIQVVEQIRKLLEAYYDRHDQVVAPVPLVDGEQLMKALDLQPGRRIGQLLTLIREGQVTGEIKTVEDALNLARLRLKR